ncbi:MAG: AIR synthase related protein [Candidatus Bipolaricaulota bacterium]
MTEEEDYRTYADAGVDISAGDRCSHIAYRACLQTHSNRKGKIGCPEGGKTEGGFSSLLSLDGFGERDYLVKNSDGVGSKALVAQRLNSHSTLAYDLIAMTVDDTAAMGAEPLVGTNILDVREARPEIVSELMDGLVEACNRAGIAMVGGEIAELSDQVKGYSSPYIWNADVIGVLEKDKQVDGAEIDPGQSVIAFKSNGIRSNGLTLAREICRSEFGTDWDSKSFRSGETWGEVLLRPSLICAPALVEMFGSHGEPAEVKLTGIAHLTGGGITNLRRILPQGKGAELDDLFPPPPELLALQEVGPVRDMEAYRTWNMGQCMLVVSERPRPVLEIASRHDIEAKVCGKITSGDEILVQSRGKEEDTLLF